MTIKKIFKLGIIIILFASLFISCYFIFFKKEKKIEAPIIENTQVQIGEQMFLKMLPDIKDDLIKNKTDFIEVNLSEMKTRLYKNGQSSIEFPILARGDVNSWGGTASGLYSVLDKNKVAWSGVADANMPYAIHFYGKYYIHGEPYYANGQKMVSDYSGGCVRLADQDVKKLYSLSKKELPVLVIDKEKDDYQYPQKQLTLFPKISAQSFLVADIDNGFVLGHQNENDILPIASLTKLMTATVISENVNLEKYITVTDQMLKDGYGNTTNLFSGEKYRIVELFYPLLIESSNDSAMALASYLGKNTTLSRMNKKAKMILMNNSNFTDPSGYDPLNKSTATDLFQLVRYISNVRPLIWDITKEKKVTSFGFNRFIGTKFWNKNMFHLDNTLIGGKTGFIKSSKSTGAFVFQFKDKDGNERRLAFILLKSDYLKRDVQKLYAWVSKNYFNP